MTDSMVDQATVWLKEWFAQRAPDVKLREQDNFFNEGAIDSFGIIELIEEVETKFSIRFSEQDFQNRGFPTIEGLARIISEKGS